VYEVREEFSESSVGNYLAANSIQYGITVVWNPGPSHFFTVYEVNLSDEDALYLTLTYKGVVATKLDK